MPDLSEGPFKIKLDIGNVKSLSINSSNEIVVFGLQKKILYMSIKDILKAGVDKLKDKKMNLLSDYKLDDYSNV